jgi:hypothetical protein
MCYLHLFFFTCVTYACEKKMWGSPPPFLFDDQRQRLDNGTSIANTIMFVSRNTTTTTIVMLICSLVYQLIIEMTPPNRFQSLYGTSGTGSRHHTRRPDEPKTKNQVKMHSSQNQFEPRPDSIHDRPSRKKTTPVFSRTSSENLLLVYKL